MGEKFMRRRKLGVSLLTLLSAIAFAGGALEVSAEENLGTDQQSVQEVEESSTDTVEGGEEKVDEPTPTEAPQDEEKAGEEGQTTEDGEGSSSQGEGAVQTENEETVENATEEKPEEAKTTSIDIMYMNDTHAKVENYPKLATAVKKQREKTPDAKLFHAGDVFSGTLYFNIFEGKADLELLNIMGIDVMVFGNHEFDLGRSENGHQSLAKFIRNAQFPFLGTNTDVSKDEHLAPLVAEETTTTNPQNGKIYNHMIFEHNGEKYGIFGLTTEDTKNTGSPEAVTFTNYIQKAKDSVALFEKAGINKIIALTHLGYNTSPEVGSDVILANSVNGIDIIVGGHSHTKLKEPVVITKENGEKTLIVQAGANADYLGVLKAVFNDKGELIDQGVELIETKGLEADPEAVELLAPYKAEVDVIAKKPIGVNSPGLPNPRHSEGNKESSVRANETRLGNLVTDAMLSKAREKFPETDIAVQNGGGIRQPIVEGPISTGQIIDVLPFGNNPVIATVTGAEIKEMLEHSVRNAPEEHGGFLHVSGMKFIYDSTKPVGERVLQMTLLRDGKETPIVADQTYLVTTNAFTGAGGDSHEVFKRAFAEGRVKDIGETDWMQLRDYIAETYSDVIDIELQDRIVDLKGAALPEAETKEQTPEETTKGSEEEKKAGEEIVAKDGDKTEKETVKLTKADRAEKKESAKKDALPKTGQAPSSVWILGSLISLLGGGLLFKKRSDS